MEGLRDGDVVDGFLVVLAYIEAVRDDFQVNTLDQCQRLDLRQTESLVRLREANEIVHDFDSVHLSGCPFIARDRFQNCDFKVFS